MTNDIDVNSEPLPGYRLIERIGAGGYGEVWRAEAPGGLTKAIKFVFGKQNEKRAVNESRALEHVRGVRHPFLLSLERIEVVNGRLLVVTELADGSVKDRFEQCRRDGQRGIPRDELLGYLRDAADALDFMGSAHALQHLDIKPENLLLLAGHVKVADFGLVKDVRQSQASMVGGMTPLYAAPEVFRGTPSRQSDQYSLAIVYQEMLTSTLPFVGSNAAELTLHHLNDEPDLSALSATDRYSVSRALSKDSRHRYTTCREFVDSLIKVTDATPSGALPVEPAAYESTSSSGFVDPKDRETQVSNIFEDEQPSEWNANASQILLDMPASECRLVDLPPVDMADRDARPAPTLVLGIGGTAGRVLTQYRKLLADQWGSAKEIPAVQFLLVDTDSRVLSETVRDESNDLTPDELLSLPLRRPQHYRENSQQLLHWLGRRWLYNIPRSLRTEGLRPLGRLALADQARQVGQRIRRAMVQALDPASLVKSSATVGQGFRNDTLRVIVVASISGGTGSGMSLDIGYAVRAVLQKLGLADAQIIGLMMHSTGRDVRHSELARVNAYSWLTEYRHFQSVDNPYPGDVSCGLPPHDAGVAAFDHTYLVQLGESLDGVEFEQATRSVADYIRFNTLSPASAFFDACRTASTDAAKPSENPAVSIRSFGVYRHSAPGTECNDEFAGIVTQQVLAVWRGATAAASAGNGEKDDKSLIQRLQIDATGIAANARTLIDLELGADPSAFLTKWLTDHGNVKLADTANAILCIDAIFGRDRDGVVSSGGVTLSGRAPATIVAPLADKLRAEIRRWVIRRIDDPSQRMAGTRQTLAWINGHFGRIQAELQRIRNALADRLNQIRVASTAVTSGKNSVKGANLPGAQEYFQVSLDQLTILAAEHSVNVIIAEVKSISDEITSLAREVDQIAAANARTIAGENSSNATSEQLTARLQSQLPIIAQQVDAKLQAEYLEANGGLMKTIMNGGRPRAQLSAKLHELSRKAVYAALASGPARSDGGECHTAGDLHSALAMATPTCLEYGGQRRVLILLPNGATSSSPDAGAAGLGAPCTTIPGSENDTTVCVEADRLSLEHIALDLVERRRDRVEFAGRVHSRTDIAWTPLLTAEAPSAAAFWGSDEARKTQAQHAMCQTLVI